MAGLAPEGNAALSDIQGISVHLQYSFGGRLDLLGWTALQRVGHYAESIRLMQAACCVASGRCEVVCAFTPSDRKVGHTVRGTCVCTCASYPYALLSSFTRKDRKIGRTVRG